MICIPSKLNHLACGIYCEPGDGYNGNWAFVQYVGIFEPLSRDQPVMTARKGGGGWWEMTCSLPYSMKSIKLGTGPTRGWRQSWRHQLEKRRRGWPGRATVSKIQAMRGYKYTLIWLSIDEFLIMELNHSHGTGQPSLYDSEQCSCHWDWPSKSLDCNKSISNSAYPCNPCTHVISFLTSVTVTWSACDLC